MFAVIALCACNKEPAVEVRPVVTGSVEEVTSWPPSGGSSVRFAWKPMTLERHDVSDRLRDGKVTHDDDRSQIVVASQAGGGLAISFVESGTGDDAFTRALSRAYHHVKIIAKADGQIDRIDGYDAFVAAVNADPESEGFREVFDRPTTRELVENTIEENYVLWVVSWLDLGWIPEPGRTVRLAKGTFSMTVSCEDLSSEAPNRRRLRVRFEGKADQISVHPTFLASVLPSDRFAEATGYYAIELVTDPATLIPVRAIVDVELGAGTGANAVKGTRHSVTTFTIKR